MTMIIEMLRKHESVETHAYKCSANKTTIGVGRNIDKNGGIGLSQMEIDYLLANDIKRVEAELSQAFNWYDDLNDARKDAMMDICFNLGLPRLMLFKKSLAAMSNRHYEIAAIELLDSRWARQVGQRAITISEIIRTGEH
tara:strand:+ start:1537 stop:1956 length:420 start_codon:yes stop_codon:yes gene_type:complete